MQLGLGFTFETTGMVLTLSALGGLVAGVAFVLLGARLPGARRYLALGYGMTAAAAWLLATRLTDGLPVSAILPVLLLQSVALPFTLILVAKLTFMDTPLEDFPHAYQFKNILRQVALMAGTGAGRPVAPGGRGRGADAPHRPRHTLRAGHPARCRRAGHAVATDRPAGGAVASANMLAVVAVVCLGIAAVAVWQRWLHQRPLARLHRVRRARARTSTVTCIDNPTRSGWAASSARFSAMCTGNRCGGLIHGRWHCGRAAARAPHRCVPGTLPPCRGSAPARHTRLRTASPAGRCAAAQAGSS